MGIYEWNRLPMGLMNAGGHFQREIGHTVLRGLMYTILELYIDDTIVPTGGATDDEVEQAHTIHCRQIFERCRKYSVKLNPKKSIMGDVELEFCGHILNKDGLSLSAEKLGFPLPETLADLKRWLGVVTYFRKHVDKHSLLTSPLDKISGNQDYQNKKKTKVVWTDEQVQAYHQTKQKVLDCLESISKMANSTLYF